MIPAPSTAATRPRITDSFTGLGGMTFSRRPEGIISRTVTVAPATTFSAMWIYEACMKLPVPP